MNSVNLETLFRQNPLHSSVSTKYSVAARPLRVGAPNPKPVEPIPDSSIAGIKPTITPISILPPDIDLLEAINNRIKNDKSDESDITRRHTLPRESKEDYRKTNDTNWKMKLIQISAPFAIVYIVVMILRSLGGYLRLLISGYCRKEYLIPGCG